MFWFTKRKVYPIGVKKIRYYTWSLDDKHMGILKENEIQYQVSVNIMSSLQADLQKQINLGNDLRIQDVTRDIFNHRIKCEGLRLKNNRHVADLLGFEAETTNVNFNENTVMHYNSGYSY